MTSDEPPDVPPVGDEPLDPKGSERSRAQSRHPRLENILHPVGTAGGMAYWTRRAIVIGVPLLVLAIVVVGAAWWIRSPVGAGAPAASEASPTLSSSPPAATPTATASPEATKASKGKGKKNKNKKNEKEQAEGEDSTGQATADPNWTKVPAPGDGGAWTNYPWGSDGLECDPPGMSPGAAVPATDPDVVVVLGDSLIRDSRAELTSALGNYGKTPVFVCWGGKNLEWGAAQVEVMRSLGVLPSCLVVNLGTNDLKGTTAQGLADAVDLPTVSSRLQYLLSTVSDISTVFTVNINANLDLAPDTMAKVGKAPQAWEEAVASTGTGAVIDWASQSSADPSLIGDDGIHDSEYGRAVRATLIADAVGSSCT